MKDKTLYDVNSIQSLNPREFTRLRPQIYCGSTEYSTQLLVEILSNSVDEYNAGHGNEITIKSGNKNGKYYVEVKDNGQGFIPNSFRDDGKSILEASFSVLNTSGKFKEDGVYEGSSLGSYGVGSKLTNFLSQEMIVSTTRDNLTEKIWFKDGIFTKREVKPAPNNTSGTTVYWCPDPQFFIHVEVNDSEVVDLIHTITCLCSNLKINYNNISYFSKNGLNDLIDNKVKNNELLKKRFVITDKNIDFVMTYTSGYNTVIVPYVNTGLTEKGPHITAVKALLTRELNKFFREKKWLKEKEENYSGEDLQEGLYIVFNLTAKGVAYDAQVKNNVSKIDMSSFVSIISSRLQEWLSANEKEAKLIFAKAVKAKKAREASKKARDAIRQPANKKERLLNLPTKLIDAWSKEREKCELVITEGDSAAGGLVEARNSQYQAIFPIRGKIISLAGKNSLEKVFNNQEIINIIKAIGLELDTKTHTLIFDESKMRYGKIIMATDADPDGYQIKNLLLTAFWFLCPELVINGYIYASIPPLFRITTKKNEYIYLKDQTELEAYKEKHKGEKFLINRNKGLGEQDSSELSVCILNESTRRIEQIIVDDFEETNALFETLMGTNVSLRKDWLLKHAEEAND